MKSGLEHYWELMERRLELLRELKRLEGEWRCAFIALDMQTSERTAADEEVVCQRIRTIDREIVGREAADREVASLTDPVQSKIRATLDKMAALHVDLRHSNEIRRAILRRSYLTIHALRNLFDSYAPTYAAPAAPSRGMIYEESV